MYNCLYKTNNQSVKLFAGTESKILATKKYNAY